MKNKESSASKIVLDSFESLFGDQEDMGKEDRVRMIPLSELYEFAGHPFRVLDDEKMQETVESIKKYGVLVPGIARKRPQDSGGGYEIISGHRRRRACELAGLTEMPMFVRDYSNDEAVVVMVDSNIQREDILPSEKARAYRMKYDALKHQGARGKKNTADAVGEAAGDSGTTVKRYIRLSYLRDATFDFHISGTACSDRSTQERSLLSAENSSPIFLKMSRCSLRKRLRRSCCTRTKNRRISCVRTAQPGRWMNKRSLKF